LGWSFTRTAQGIFQVGEDLGYVEGVGVFESVSENFSGQGVTWVCNSSHEVGDAFSRATYKKRRARRKSHMPELGLTSRAMVREGVRGGDMEIQNWKFNEVVVVDVGGWDACPTQGRSKEG